jgi:hypothetical protein
MTEPSAAAAPSRRVLRLFVLAAAGAQTAPDQLLSIAIATLASKLNNATIVKESVDVLVSQGRAEATAHAERIVTVR